ncbi:MAG: heme A synthase [Paracoccaceae bacterium]
MARSIFEDVGDAAPRAAPRGGMIDAASQGRRGWVRAWLWVLFALVVLMIAVGGMTRLTDSGLAITEWAPVTGAIPPLSAEAWQAEFDLYRAIPEYQLQNRGMTMEQFQVIYWWEWGHRQLGRVIGLVWGVGFAALWATGSIPRGWHVKLLIPGILGGIQGAIGWWMVSSGLREGMVDVASYRLATHLGLAFAILGLLAWLAFDIARRPAERIASRRQGDAGLARLGTVLAAATFAQILLGALVAGIDAGRMYPTWPLMAGGILPPQPFDLTPWWRNFFEDAGLVQFVHRTTAYLLAAFAVVVWWRARRSPHAATRAAHHWMLGAVGLQVVIGIAAVLSMAAWPVAIAHQATAVLLWVLVLRARYLARTPAIQSLRAPA